MNDLRGKDSYPLKNGNKTASSDVLNYDDSPFTRFVWRHAAWYCIALNLWGMLVNNDLR